MAAKSILRTCFVLMFVLGRSPVASATMPEYNNTDIEHPSPTQGSKETFQRSLSGLYSIPSYRSPTLFQSHSDFDTLYCQAQSAQTELEQVINQVSLISGTQAVLPGVKSKTRAKIKLATELGGRTELLTDLARGSIVANDIGTLVQTFELLNKEVTIVEIKNRFKHPAPSGYRDLKLLVRLPETQHIAEIQLHLDMISEIKNGAEHDIYEQIQIIERQAKLEARNLNDLELAKLKSLRHQSLEMYQSAWHQYLQPEAIAS